MLTASCLCFCGGSTNGLASTTTLRYLLTSLFYRFGHWYVHLLIQRSTVCPTPPTRPRFPPKLFPSPPAKPSNTGETVGEADDQTFDSDVKTALFKQLSPKKSLSFGGLPESLIASMYYSVVFYFECSHASYIHGPSDYRTTAPGFIAFRSNVSLCLVEKARTGPPRAGTQNSREVHDTTSLSVYYLFFLRPPHPIRDTRI